jgi:hypothetical protein
MFLLGVFTYMYQLEVVLGFCFAGAGFDEAGWKQKSTHIYSTNIPHSGFESVSTSSQLHMYMYVLY